VVLTCHP